MAGHLWGGRHCRSWLNSHCSEEPVGCWCFMRLSAFTFAWIFSSLFFFLSFLFFLFLFFIFPFLFCSFPFLSFLKSVAAQARFGKKSGRLVIHEVEGDRMSAITLPAFNWLWILVLLASTPGSLPSEGKHSLCWFSDVISPLALLMVKHCLCIWNFVMLESGSNSLEVPYLWEDQDFPVVCSLFMKWKIL